MKSLLVAIISSATLVLTGAGAATANVATAATVSAHPFMTYEAAANNLYKADPSAAEYAFNNPASIITGSVPDGLKAAPADRFTSEATFASEASSIPKGTYVDYDIESGSGFSPADEAAAPDKYMKLFNQVAIANGLKPIITPARDLGNSAQDCPKQSGEGLDAWSLRCNLWGHAAAGSGGNVIVDIQTQADTTNLANFDNLFNKGSAEIHSWFSTAQAFAEISTTYGTASQEEAAVHSIAPQGLYYSFTSSGVSTADAVVKNLQSSGF